MRNCACTRSGFSGSGNTEVVGCALHANGELSGDKTTCYVQGGTECTLATASVLGKEDLVFSTAAWRECGRIRDAVVESSVTSRILSSVCKAGCQAVRNTLFPIPVCGR